MTEVAYEPVAPLARTPSAVPAVQVVRRPRWQSFLIALGSLVGIYGVALGVMVGGAALVHLNFPTKHVNAFAAFHNVWVVGVLLGIAVLWLLPPYPWARRAIGPLPQRQPARRAGATVVGDRGVVTAHHEMAGPGAAPRPNAQREAGHPLSVTHDQAVAHAASTATGRRGS